MPTIKSMFTILFGTPRRRNTAAPYRCQFEMLESRIVLAAGACGAAIQRVDANVIGVTNQSVEAPLEQVSHSAVGVTAFPDVCLTPPGLPLIHALDANDSEPLPIGANPSASRFANAGSVQAVVVIKHADGTIEWIYDLPSVKVDQSGNEGGGLWNSSIGNRISGHTLDGIRTGTAQGGGGIFNHGTCSLMQPEPNAIIAILIGCREMQAGSEHHPADRESDSSANRLDLLFVPGTAFSVPEGLLSDSSDCSVASPELGWTESTDLADGETTGHGRIASFSPAPFVIENGRASTPLMTVVGDWNGDGFDILRFAGKQDGEGLPR